jgi:hypothetical protein
MEYAKNQVVIEVLGGVAEVVRCPSDIEVIIIDHDNDMNGDHE